MELTRSEGNSVFVDPEWIDAHLGDPQVRIVEVDVSPKSYESGHIPGATLWDAYADLRGADYLPVNDEEMQRLVEGAGVDADTTVVFYGYGAALGFWLLSAHGHHDVRMLDGPRERWSEFGKDWSLEAPRIVVSSHSYQLQAQDPALSASREDVEAAIGNPEAILLDVRSELEFDGERFWPSGATEDVGRAGHLPGAVNVPIDHFRTSDGALRAPQELRDALAEKGVDGDKPIIIYCTIGNRASQAWVGLRHLLDYPRVSVYYPSWVEWGRRDDAPIE